MKPNYTYYDVNPEGGARSIRVAVTDDEDDERYQAIELSVGAGQRTESTQPGTLISRDTAVKILESNPRTRPGSALLDRFEAKVVAEFP